MCRLEINEPFYDLQYFLGSPFIFKASSEHKFDCNISSADLQNILAPPIEDRQAVLIVYCMPLKLTSASSPLYEWPSLNIVVEVNDKKLNYQSCFCAEVPRDFFKDLRLPSSSFNNDSTLPISLKIVADNAIKAKSVIGLAFAYKRTVFGVVKKIAE
jgi:hypothetical protein